MYTTDFAYDGPFLLVPLSLSYPSSPVFLVWNEMVLPSCVLSDPVPSGTFSSGSHQAPLEFSQTSHSFPVITIIIIITIMILTIIMTMIIITILQLSLSLTITIIIIIQGSTFPGAYAPRFGCGPLDFSY